MNYAAQRGFRTFNDWPYHQRGFIECWAAPGFHRFWQLWNPGISYFVYRLFLRLGGRRRWIFPTLGAFLGCGIAHTLVVLPFTGRWSMTLVVTFFCFGVLTVVSRRLQPYLSQVRWPWPANVLVNAGLVIGSFDIGFRIEHLWSSLNFF